MIQLALAFFGLSAMFMATGHNPRARKFAPVLGLCSQPFWYFTAMNAQALGACWRCPPSTRPSTYAAPSCNGGANA